MKPFTLFVNGEELHAPVEMANAPLAAFLKTTRFKSVKIACGEGGCGACTVALVEQSSEGGAPSLRTINSCLAPVYSVRGKSILTAEGLPPAATAAATAAATPATAGGPAASSVVVERLAAHHASQCGYCTPGFAVACHAALHNAANGCSGSSSNGHAHSNGNGCSSNGGAAAAESAPLLDGEGLRRALDGNLCRCTGYRPIVSACRSVGVADIEDLAGPPAAGAALLLPPRAAAAAAATADDVEEVALGAGQVLKVPRSLAALVAESGRLAAAAASAAATGSFSSWRLVAGHTGPGVYKDWPLAESVLLSVNEVPELRRLQQTDDGLVVGGAVTLEALAAHLDGKLAAGGGGGGVGSVGGGVKEWAAETAAHLRRIAGTHVRNAATVGGNLVLTAEAALPSDVATLLAAAGAEVELLLVSSDAAAHGVSRRMPLLDFVSGGGAAAKPAAGGYILTAVHVPLPHHGVRFWSQRIAERYSNAAAVANAAVSLRLQPAADGAAAGGATASVVAEARVVVGVRTDAAAGGGVAAARNAAKETDPTVVLLYGWDVRRLTAVEAALAGAPATPAALAAALAAAAPDLAAIDGVDAATAAIAEGLVVQGIFAAAGVTTATANGANGAAAAAADVAAPSRLPPPELVAGTQSYPAPLPEVAPVTEPTIKLGAKLQATGTAQYTEDVPVHKGALYGAYVMGAKAGAVLEAIDATPALALPGAVRFVGAADLEAGANGSNGYGYTFANRFEALRPGAPPPEPIFLPAGGRVEYAGQPVGLVLAESAAAAHRAAKAVQLSYRTAPSSSTTTSTATATNTTTTDAPPPPTVEPITPLLDIESALAARALYPLAALMPWLPAGKSLAPGPMTLAPFNGDVDALLAAAGAPPAAAAAGLPPPPPPAAEPPADGGSSSGEAAAATANGSSSSSSGDANGSSRERKLRVVRGRYYTPSQLHVYMETQSAVAAPEEDGGMTVQSACQGTDVIQGSVAAALGLPLSKVTARCRRLGGAFGGKATLSRRVAAAAAVAAAITGRQVRLQLPRNADMVLNGGRADCRVDYVAVLEEQAAAPTTAAAAAASHVGPTRWRLAGLDVFVAAAGGAFPDIAWLDAMGLCAAVDSLYDIPHMRCEVAMVRTNLPPRTAVRGPGEVNGTMIIEQVMEHVAAELGVNPEAFRAATFLQLPPSTAAATTAKTVTTATDNGTAAAAAPAGPSEADVEAEAGPADAGAVAEASTTQPSSAAAAATAADGSDQSKKEEEVLVLKTAFGKKIPAPLYTLPRLWHKLMREAGWEAMQAEVDAFNAAHPWTKRGLAALPARYGMQRGNKPAYVNILTDGTVQVACHGIEMGQGLFTKVAQVAAATLSEALPPANRPMDLSNIKICDNSSELLPNSGVTGGSTSSELAAAAVRLACLQLVDILKTKAVPKLKGKESFTWKELVAATSGGWGPANQLGAFAWGGQADLPEASGAEAAAVPTQTDYSVIGVAGALVELDVLTGERRVLRADILFDLGRPVNPAVDIGQVEGAFVMGLGMMLSEAASYDQSAEEAGGGTGALVQNSTWHYKPPAAACVPAQFNVTLLDDAPLSQAGPISSKACGEPPLLLSTAVLMALQRATAAARADAAGGCSADFVPLIAPATVQRVRTACGDWNAAERLQKAAAAAATAKAGK
ncbi:hypothetical protein CHLRE_11g467688v5 [Chlamydomonas reinhardtii]|uniref:FAD-binding PCMH-type domain-containing protein n=1 Tax=Chlamydomonas reinhardtii TaxID=3055 RepID=A0A2K3D7P2_CHLRE|nr:uncharacterized protein CHLRE_11g467688v5 [Chlamydomonas reinhardtii]PNW76553.1 hypothetical protein CHLRE_11g467688v5 [Chlamydomonas reinhardtii]